MRRDYPAIVKRAKAQGAEMHWSDETGVSNQANYGRSFAPKGETPVITRPATRVSKTWGSLLAYLGLIGLADA
jgi:hypothetical protein